MPCTCFKTSILKNNSSNSILLKTHCQKPIWKHGHARPLKTNPTQSHLKFLFQIQPTPALVHLLTHFELNPFNSSPISKFNPFQHKANLKPHLKLLKNSSPSLDTHPNISSKVKHNIFLFSNPIQKLPLSLKSPLEFLTQNPDHS